jgi:hypothetical protein
MSCTSKAIMIGASSPANIFGWLAAQFGGGAAQSEVSDFCGEESSPLRDRELRASPNK